MSDLQKIHSTLEQTARRRRVDRALRGFWQGLFIGGAVWLVMLAAYKLLPLPEWVWLWSPGALGLGAVAGLVWGWARPMTMMETARWVDERTKLQERLSTALEVGSAGQGADETWRNLVVTDAAKRLPEVDPKKLLPFHLPNAGKWALVVLILGVGLGFVPEYRSKDFVQKKLDQEVIKETGRELAELTKRHLEARPPAMEKTQKALEEVNDLGAHLNQAKLTKSEALKDLASMTEKLKEQAKDLAKNPALKNLEKAARTSSKGGSPSADLQKQMDNLAKQLGANASNPEALEQFRKDLEQAKEMAANLPKGNDAAAKEAQEKMEASLADLAKQAKDLGLDLPSLSEAIAALQNAMPDQVLKDLEFVEMELEKMEQMAKALEKMQMDAQQLGKDLAEQLKFGQAEAAESTLRKMAEQLAKGKMSQEDLQKVMEQVEKALDPAKQYGEVSEHLKAALGQCKGGSQGEASQSLQEAAAALAKLSQELGDAQSLLATLEALQQAQMCIANGQGWAQSKSGRPRAGEGGQPGRGVGTWTDENSWDYPEFSERWDNTGIERSDQDGKGISDRGDGQLADNLAPTKIKGQITPGGPMPSVTLKGVSIKGTSKVEFEEMAAGAQSEAQAALNQDQVPRAYQNAVRNYFDDLDE